MFKLKFVIWNEEYGPSLLVRSNLSGKEAVSTLRHFGKLSCDQKNDRSFPLVRRTTNRSSRHNQSESLLQVNTCSDKGLLLVVTRPVWIIYCFIFYDWLNLYLDTHRSVWEARILLEDWESCRYKEFDWKARSAGLTLFLFPIKYHFDNSKQTVCPELVLVDLLWVAMIVVLVLHYCNVSMTPQFMYFLPLLW